MTEILEKTGLVERSGQGVDKIFSITLSEGKAEPDYKDSEMFQVSLTLRTEIIDKAFHIFVSQYQNSEKQPKLGVEQIITLCKIRNGIFQHLRADIIDQLKKTGLIEKVSGHTNRYTLSDEYHQLAHESLRIGKRYLIKEIELILLAIQGSALKIGDLAELLKDSLSRNQINYLNKKLVDDEVIKVEGRIKGAKYSLVDKYADLRDDVLISTVVAELRSKYD